MKEIRQTKFGAEGNCFTACLASMLDLEIDKVPDFANMVERKGQNWFNRVQGWLYRRNIECLFIVTESPEVTFKGIYCIEIGDCERSTVATHAVILKNGLFHFDPHPSKAGLLNNREPKDRVFIVLASTWDDKRVKEVLPSTRVKRQLPRRGKSLIKRATDFGWDYEPLDSTLESLVKTWPLSNSYCLKRKSGKSSRLSAVVG